MTPSDRETGQRRRHVVGYILGSIIVGVVGLVTAIIMTVTGILNPFDEVSASYEDVFETGTEVGQETTPVELDDATYTVLTFSESAQQPTPTEQLQACSITNEYGDEIPVATSIEPVTDTMIDTAEYDLSESEYVIYTNFEAQQGAYTITCEALGILSDGADYDMGGTAVSGVLIGMGSLAIAAVLFFVGVLNHSRQRNEQRKNPRRLVDYRWEDS